MVPAGELKTVKQALQQHIELTRQESGCLIFQVTETAADPCRFDVYEEFTDRAAFEHHQARVQSSQWGAITANVERHYRVWEETA